VLELLVKEIKAVMAAVHQQVLAAAAAQVEWDKVYKQVVVQPKVEMVLLSVSAAILYFMPAVAAVGQVKALA
jgi:hypothetical protein